jgi:ribosomal protein S18 acetylase RimI-like enzyme
MIDIGTLIEFRAADVERRMPGYTSHEKYVVTRTETPDEVMFAFKRTTLKTPYVKVFSPEDYVYLMYGGYVQAGTSLGVYDGDALVGIAITEAQTWNRTLWIWEFGVQDTHQRQGIGLRMMDELAQQSRAAGLRIMVVEAQNTNGPAVRFYRRAGFHFDALDLTF